VGPGISERARDRKGRQNRLLTSFSRSFRTAFLVTWERSAWARSRWTEASSSSSVGGGRTPRGAAEGKLPRKFEGGRGAAAAGVGSSR
jgi:hypothetical protein